MLAGLASTMIMVSLSGAKYGIAIAAESATLTLLNTLWMVPFLSCVNLSELAKQLIDGCKILNKFGTVPNHVEK